MKNKLSYYYKKYNGYYILLILGMYLLKLIMYEFSCNINTNGHLIHMKIDELIPFCKYFVILYYTYYWLPPLLLYLTSYTDTKKFYRLLISATSACIIANICYITYQVQMVRPEINGNDFFDLWVKFTYFFDPQALNCFPSVHAVMGVFMIIASYKTNKFPKWLQIASFISGIGCILSTVFIKQHYFIDVVAGVFLMSIAYVITLFVDKKIQKKKATSQ